MKKTLHPILLCLLIVVGNTSCMLADILNDPTPAVREENQLPTKVAILPFVNQTSNPEAGRLIRKMFYNFFSSLNYRDLELSAIDANLKTNKLYQKTTAGEEISAKKLGQLLGVDAVIFGEVLSLGKLYALVYSSNEAGLKARMVRCDSERVIWELEHTVRLQEGDVPLSLTGLAATIVKTAVTHQLATHMKAAAELCMQMVATIPNPPAVTDPPPKIQALVHNGAGKLLRPGDDLKVVMIGDKDQEASWSIPPLIENLPMTEKEPGVYLGSYRIKLEDRLPHGRLIGYLTSDSGSGSQWVDTLGPLKIGEPTVLPAVVTRDMVLEVRKSPYLVQDALLVLPGVKLTIEPGTVIWFQSLGLIVKGEIQILGTRQDPVRLASLGSVSWKGIFIDRSSMDNKLNYCEVSGAEFGFRSSKATVSIQNCLFQDNVWGIVIDEGTAEISSSLIRTSTKTGIAVRKARLQIKDSVITENQSGGFLLENSQAKIELNNILNNGGWGVKSLGDQGYVLAGNNWWGKETPGRAEIIGPVNVQPILKKPVDFEIME